MTARCAKTSIPSYYAVFIDHGRRGLEAIVQPELTRANIIDRIKSGEFKDIAFIHYVEDGLAEIVTHDLIEAAEGELKVEAINRAERMAYRHDHERKLRVAS